MIKTSTPCTPGFALAIIFRCGIGMAATVPSFSDFAVPEDFDGQPAKPILATKEERMFRTVLRSEAAAGPNFAGRLRLAEWGCGAACISWAIIDARSGKVWLAPFTVSAPSCDDSPAYCEQGIDFNRQSELIVITGARNESGAGRYYYRFHAGRLKLLMSAGSDQARQTP